MNVQRAFETRKAAIGEFLRNLLAGEDASRRGHQQCEQVKFEGSQISRRAARGDGVSRGVEDEVTHREDSVRVGRGLPASKNGAHARDEFAHPKRFDHVVVRAQFESQHGVGLLLFRGDDDNGRLLFFSILAQKFKAIHLRHHNVEQDRVGVGTPRFVDGLLPVRRGDDTEALLGEVVLQELANAGGVVHDENGFHVPMINENGSDLA